MKKYVIIVVSVVLLLSCKDVQKTKIEPLLEDVVTEENHATKVHPGKLIMEQECYICHDPKASRANRIAPPMEAIKRHYKDSNTTKEEFTQALLRWVNDPQTESKMLGAHAKFGPMPYIPNPDDAVAQIAHYLYDNEIEMPLGFDAHFKKAHKKGEGMGACECFTDQFIEKEYAAIGLAHAMEAKADLGRNLKKAIQEKGTVGAIRFCHTEATKLTDSVSMMNNAIIKRVSDKARNPENQANEEEVGYIKNFKKMVASGDDVKPIVNVNEGKVKFYYPIITNVLCLQCHGKPKEQIQPVTLAALKLLYPTDNAIGYDVNEVRGMWSIDFDTEY
jgi:hypothetical protein